ncbi:MAG: DHH family phosphoesterase [Patescibacteria group bacterium]|nr:DHH family phosphoesterase [Patescibacteria group bacterium]
MKPILITCYVNPDIDGYAGVIAYAEFLKKKGKSVVAGIMGEPHDEAKYVLNRFSLERMDVIQDDELFDEVVLVDASDVNGLQGKIVPEKVIEIIDHRKINEANRFVNAKTQIELVGAAATLVAEKFKEENIEISQRSAILLYSAIISNTLNFKGGVTTDRDKEMAKWLRQFIEVSDEYWKELFTAKSDLTGDKLITAIKGDLAWFDFGNTKVGIAQLEIIGAEELIKHRADEIVATLHKIKEKMGLDLIFQNILELELMKNYFVAEDNQIKTLLEEILEVKFDEAVAKRDQLIMRKQIVPLLKAKLEL